MFAVPEAATALFLVYEGAFGRDWWRKKHALYDFAGFRAGLRRLSAQPAHSSAR
jgi:hypothetical protein